MSALDRARRDALLVACDRAHGAPYAAMAMATLPAAPPSSHDPYHQKS